MEGRKNWGPICFEMGSYNLYLNMMNLKDKQ